jgi:tetratricopeptide (TPR) repeat protein
VAGWRGGEVVRRFDQAPEHQQEVEQARGLQAVELVLDGAWATARALLEALAAGTSAHPPRDELLLHLAVACEHLDDWTAAAERRVQRLAALPEGDARRAAEALPIARALLRAGRAQEAQPLLAAHVEAHADDNLALFELAGVEESLDRLDEAQRLYGRLVERLAEEDELRPRALDARERLAQRLAGRPAPPPPEGTQRADESADPQAPAAGPVGAGGP